MGLTGGFVMATTGGAATSMTLSASSARLSKGVEVAKTISVIQELLHPPQELCGLSISQLLPLK